MTRLRLALVALALAALAAPARAVEKDQLDAAFAALNTYDWGTDRATLDPIDQAINETAGDAAARKEIEKRLIALLGAQSPRAAKDFACRKLWIIGSVDAVPALAPLLTDKDLSHMARYCLERMAFAEAGKALRDALPTATGVLRVGIINSLGMRGDADAVAMLIGLINDKDPETAAAAAVALGRAATPDAAKALAAFRSSAPKALQTVAVEASLDLALRLLAKGSTDDAAKVYQELEAEGQPPHVRVAAFRGLVLSRPAEAAPRLVKALAGTDETLRNQAAQLAVEAPGPEATKTLADALPTLPPTGQVLLIRALALRADAVARPAVLAAAKSNDAAVRAAAIAALAAVGNATDVSLLASSAASDDKDAAAAAQACLATLKGDGVDEAIVTAMKGAAPTLRAALIHALAARSARGCLPAVVEAAADADATVRAAALDALAELGGTGQAPIVVTALKAAKEDSARAAAERALLAIATRGGQAAADPVLAGMEGAQPAARAILLRALGRIGGPKALAAVRKAADDADDTVKDAAIRVLADWPDLAAAEPLLDLAKSAAKMNHKILAFRGYVRLIDLERSPAAKAKMLAEADPLAKRPDEKKLILAALGGIPTVESLQRLNAALDEPALVEEASAAVVRIARDIPKKDRDLLREALTTVVAKTKNKRTRQDAQKALGGLRK